LEAKDDDATLSMGTMGGAKSNYSALTGLSCMSGLSKRPSEMNDVEVRE
jgi:hypothetical protein